MIVCTVIRSGNTSGTGNAVLLFKSQNNQRLRKQLEGGIATQHVRTHLSMKVTPLSDSMGHPDEDTH